MPGMRRVRALTTLTLVAGLASTVFAPLTAALAGALGWRGTYLVLAGILAVVTIPAVVATLVLSSMVAFVVARFNFKFNLALLGMFTAANLLPP